jgi:hypothetical protein
MLGLLALLGSALLVLLVARVWRSRDSLGTLLLVALLMILCFGVYDLARAPRAGVAVGPLPAEVVHARARHPHDRAAGAARGVQRALESALQREMASARGAAARPARRRGQPPRGAGLPRPPAG